MVEMGYNREKIEDKAMQYSKRLQAYQAQYYKRLQAYQAYVEIALWYSDDNGGGRLVDKYSMGDLAPITVEKLQSDVDTFFKILQSTKDGDRTLLESAGRALEYAGYSDAECRLCQDLWLTQNRHWAGFLDGNYGSTVGYQLNEIAKQFREFDLHVGDDGLIYVSYGAYEAPHKTVRTKTKVKAPRKDKKRSWERKQRDITLRELRSEKYSQG